MQIYNGATIIGYFNAATGIVTGLNVQASGALCAGGFTPASYGSTYKLQVLGGSALQSSATASGTTVLSLAGAIVTGSMYAIKADLNSTGTVLAYFANNNNGSVNLYLDSLGTNDALVTYRTASTTIWAHGIDQSDSNSWVLSKNAALGTSNALRIDATSLSMSLYDGLSFATVAKGITYKSGTGARAGNATLTAGTVTITNTSVTANTIVIYCVKTLGGTPGNLSYTLSAGTSLTINSDNPLDTSTISYQLMELV